jgi:hypothetical protein
MTEIETINASEPQAEGEPQLQAISQIQGESEPSDQNALNIKFLETFKSNFGGDLSDDEFRKNFGTTSEKGKFYLAPEELIASCLNGGESVPDYKMMEEIKERKELVAYIKNIESIEFALDRYEKRINIVSNVLIDLLKPQSQPLPIAQE